MDSGHPAAGAVNLFAALVVLAAGPAPSPRDMRAALGEAKFEVTAHGAELRKTFRGWREGRHCLRDLQPGPREEILASANHVMSVLTELGLADGVEIRIMAGLLEKEGRLDTYNCGDDAQVEGEIDDFFGQLNVAGRGPAAARGLSVLLGLREQAPDDDWRGRLLAPRLEQLTPDDEQVTPGVALSAARTDHTDGTVVVSFRVRLPEETGTTDEATGAGGDPNPAWMRYTPWALGGISLCTAVAGGVIGGMALNDYRDFRDDPMTSRGYAGRRDELDRDALTADILLGTAVVAGVTALLFHTWGFDEPSPWDDRR